MTEQELEQALIGKLSDLKYTHRPDIHDRAAQGAKLAALQTDKRGLMQQLFPPPEEVQA